MKTTALAALACTAIIGSAPTVNAQSQQPDAPATLTAQFTDGWMAPYFGLTTDAQRTWDMEVRMEQDGSKLRVINPYGSAGFKLAAGESNATTEPHDIVFDISDPDFVRVELGEAYTSPEGVLGNGMQTVWVQGRADYLVAAGRTPRSNHSERAQRYFRRHHTHCATGSARILLQPAPMWRNMECRSIRHPCGAETKCGRDNPDR